VPWAWAFDTPFKWMKQIPSFFGGTRNGMVISWPAKIKDKGGIRAQFHHVVDIVPTLLEATGIPAPIMVDGFAQKPIEGVSMGYTFDKANAYAPSPHHIQYFEMLGVHGRGPKVCPQNRGSRDPRWKRATSVNGAHRGTLHWSN
jgi:arylsulfatase A-like enzyme